VSLVPAEPPKGKVELPAVAVRPAGRAPRVPHKARVSPSDAYPSAVPYGYMSVAESARALGARVWAACRVPDCTATIGLSVRAGLYQQSPRLLESSGPLHQPCSFDPVMRDEPVSPTRRPL
jgi:hypothetical protein